jgi:anti-sigma regulatory factor (Ser/Thr protein kinase)
MAAMADATADWLARHGVGPQDAGAIGLKIYEIVGNVFSHGGAPALVVQVALRLRADSVEGEVIDNGAPFDPLAAVAPDTGAALEDRAIGSLGILLVRRLMDGLDYARRDGRNWLCFTKKFELGR